MKNLFKTKINIKCKVQKRMIFLFFAAIMFMFGGCWTDGNTPESPAYTNASLNGDYLFMMSEVHNSGTQVEYNEIAGTMSFKGDGTATINGSKRNSDGSTSSISNETFSYSVNNDGSFIIPGGKPLHGQILLNGSSLLLDGSQLGTDPTLYLNDAIAMKRITKGAAPTYTYATLNGDYLFRLMLTEVFSGGQVVYVEVAGTMTFNGDGTGKINAVKRYSNDGTKYIITNEDFSYSVNSDGSFIIPGGKPLHGQIVLDGNCLLMDGTQLGPDPTWLLSHAVSMKQVTSGAIPTYNSTSLNGDYLLMETEVYSENTGIVTYVEGAGTMSFNGIGSLTVSGPDRHSYSDGSAVKTENKTETIDYSVDGSGSLILNPSVNPTHGQIVLDGNCLLLDGTMLTNDNYTTNYLGHGIVMKR